MEERKHMFQNLEFKGFADFRGNQKQKLLALNLLETGMEILHQKLSNESQMYQGEYVTPFQATSVKNKPNKVFSTF